MRFLALIPYLLIFTGIGLSNMGILPAMGGWVLSAFGILLGLAAAIMIIYARGRNGRPHFWVFATLAVLPITVAVPMVISDFSYPRINDVTTDIENPPVFVAALQVPANIGRDMTFPEHFGPIVHDAYPAVRPLILDGTPEQIFGRVENLAAHQPGWVITHRDAKKGTLEGEVTTSFFRFVDDFVIRVSDQEGKARVDMRSKSRDGLVDAGANANRIEAFFAQLARELGRGDSESQT